MNGQTDEHDRDVLELKMVARDPEKKRAKSCSAPKRRHGATALQSLDLRVTPE
jgi:hypothetical protein